MRRFEGEGPIDRKGGIDFGAGVSVTAFQDPAQLGKDDVGDEENSVLSLMGIEQGLDPQGLLFVVAGQEAHQDIRIESNQDRRFRKSTAPAIPSSICSISSVG